MLVMGLSVGAVMGIWLAMVGFRTGSVAVTSRYRLKGMAAKVGSSV